jgi:hypothetical protein
VIDLGILWDAAELERRFGSDRFTAERFTQSVVTIASAYTAQSLDLRVRLRSLDLHALDAPRDDLPASLRRGTIDLMLTIGRVSGDAIDVPSGSICSEEATGRIALTESADEASAALALVEAIAIAAGASTPTLVDGRLDDESIAAIWSHLDRLDRTLLGGAESGAWAASDHLVLVPGSLHVIHPIVNDDLTNCGPLALIDIDARSDRGHPISRGDDASGQPVAWIWIPPGADGSDALRYRVALAHLSEEEEAIAEQREAEGRITLRIPTVDLNHDGRVDRTDIALLLERWGSADPQASQGDLDGNGQIDAADLGVLLGSVDLWRSSS